MHMESPIRLAGATEAAASAETLVRGREIEAAAAEARAPGNRALTLLGFRLAGLFVQGIAFLGGMLGESYKDFEKSDQEREFV